MFTQNNNPNQKTKHYHSHIPKGSYHTYCRNRLTHLYQGQQDLGIRNIATRGNTRSFHTYRSAQHNEKSPLQTAQTFEQYLRQFERPATVANKNKNKQKNRENRPTSKQNLKKIDNQQIIDSHLPFFKCKLERTQLLIKRPDFRVKETKFKVNRNVVQANLCAFLGNSLPLQ